jgi:hypothetical protein
MRWGSKALYDSPRCLTCQDTLGEKAKDQTIV